jgi:hypothetical protein
METSCEFQTVLTMKVNCKNNQKKLQLLVKFSAYYLISLVSSIVFIALGYDEVCNDDQLE